MPIITASNDTRTVSQLRARYRKMQEAGRAMFGTAWDVAVADSTPIDPTPAEWVEAAETVTITCERCKGTGNYNWGGTVNGKPVHTATCYHCKGRGRQTMADMFRNFKYILYSISRAV